MNGLVCKTCGYVAINGAAPDKCPVCMSPKDVFQEKADALKTAEDEQDKAEKHTPVITTTDNSTCKLSEGCMGVKARIGSIVHPMEKEHYIVWIDFYLDKEWVARTHLSPEKLKPAVSININSAKGKITVVEHCNLHGSWIAEKDL